MFVSQCFARVSVQVCLCSVLARSYGSHVDCAARALKVGYALTGLRSRRSAAAAPDLNVRVYLLHHPNTGAAFAARGAAHWFGVLIVE